MTAGEPPLPWCLRMGGGPCARGGDDVKYRQIGDERTHRGFFSRESSLGKAKRWGAKQTKQYGGKYDVGYGVIEIIFRDGGRRSQGFNCSEETT